MAGYSDIVGHERIIKHLRSAVRTGNVSHAYIFDGPDHSGKRLLADAFSMALQCERQDGDPCMECRSCRQALGLNQPDIIRVTHEKPKTVSVRDIREQLNDDIVIRPYSSKRKVYIVDDAEMMNQQAQNALLKTIEEPPSYAVILLLTNNAEGFLPTIRSRCVMLGLRAVPREQIRDFLMRTKQMPDYRADLCAAFSQGNVGKAVMLAGSQDFIDLRDLTVRQLKEIQNAKDYTFAGEIKKLNELKMPVSDYLDLVRMWFRDVLVCKTTDRTEGLINSDYEREISRQADRCSYSGLQKILEEIGRADRRIKANVSQDLTLELMLMRIREAAAER